MRKVGITHSFSTRVSLSILLATGAIFAVAFIIFYYSTREMVRKDAIKLTESALTNTVMEVDNVLQSIEIAVDNMAWVIPESIDKPDSLYNIVRRMLANNPYISGSAIAFEPYYYPDRGQYFSPYAYRSEDSTQTIQLGNDNYDYHHKDWYQVPKRLGTAYWIEPYFDDGGGNILMSTYSRPLFDESGNQYAIFTADISLDWLIEKVNSYNVYPNSYNLLVDQKGAYMAHPYSAYILEQTISTSTLDIAVTGVTDLGQAMINGGWGRFPFTDEDKNELWYAFYAPVERSGWSVAILCPHNDVFAEVNDIRTMVLFISIAGLLLLLVFCFYIIRQLINPLTELADSALIIANGNLEAPLPSIKKRHDEMGKLYESFGYMQQSLSAYVQELKTTTAKKERIESELRIANEIQMGMIPKIFPPFPDRDDIDIYAILVPAKEVGGDLYDFFIEEGKLYFTVGDVSGKGVPASLLMAMTRSLFRTMASYLKTPSAIVASLNDSISETNQSGMFVTLFVGVLDLKTGELCYCNAGHNAPIVLSSTHQATCIDVIPNLPLGVFTGFPYQEQHTIVPPDTNFFAYTDGVTEAENTKLELFTDERLFETLDGLQLTRPVDIINHIVHQVEGHAAGAEQNDDLTMLCLHYAPRHTEKTV